MPNITNIFVTFMRLEEKNLKNTRIIKAFGEILKYMNFYIFWNKIGTSSLVYWLNQ